MKYLNNTLYIEFKEFIGAGIPLGTVKAALSRNATGWLWILDPDDSRKVLIEYASLKPQYKEAIQLKFGDPYAYASAAIIKQQLSTPQEDYQFIHDYKIPDGNNLPLDKQAEYLSACSYLYLLSTASCRAIRTVGFASVRDFYRFVIQLITNEKIALPTAYSRLKAKVRAYKEQGAACVISRKFCNDNSKKVKDEISEAVLLEMISHSSQFDDVYVSRQYNQWAEVAGYKPITDATVGNYRRRNLMLVTASRDGLQPWQNRFGKIIHRTRPSSPLMLINSDDNNLDLFFKDGKNNYRRVTAYFVVDTYNDYILGYSIDWKQTADGVKAAFLNALHHIHELTGEYGFWHQLQADHWGIKSLKSFYTCDGLVRFTPPRVGNARGKSVERLFAEMHYDLKPFFNYGGHNITAKTKLNQDKLKRNAKDFPSIEQAPAQIEMLINRLRTKIQEKTGMSRQEQWLRAWNEMPHDYKRTLTDKQRLLHFGYRHTHHNTLTNAGINITLGGHRLSYDVAREDYIKHVGKAMNLMFDPYDLSQVLALSDDGRTQLLCPAYEKTKMALLDMGEGDRARLNSLINEQKLIGQHVFDLQNRRRDLLIGSGIDAEGLLQAGVMIKETRQLAENTYYELLQENKADQLPPLSEEQDEPEDDYWDKRYKAGLARPI
jgi:hypothetical protein